jgi:hypothetical protein
VIAANPLEHLSRAVAPIVRTTFGTGAGRAWRIDSDKPHSAIMGQLLDPLAHAPVCSWSGGFTETLVSFFLLAGSNHASAAADRHGQYTAERFDIGRKSCFTSLTQSAVRMKISQNYHILVISLNIHHLEFYDSARSEEMVRVRGRH